MSRVVSRGRGGALDLGEQQPTLEGGEDGDGQVVGVGAWGQPTLGVEGLQLVADGVGPVCETGGDAAAGLWARLGELPAESAERAAAPALISAAGFSENQVPPGPEPVVAGEVGTSLGVGARRLLGGR